MQDKMETKTMEPTIYNIDNYMSLRKPSTVKPIPVIVQFPNERVHWKNYHEQKEGAKEISSRAENDAAIEEAILQREREILSQKSQRTPLLATGTAPSVQQLNYENTILGY